MRSTRKSKGGDKNDTWFRYGFVYIRKSTGGWFKGSGKWYIVLDIHRRHDYSYKGNKSGIFFQPDVSGNQYIFLDNEFIQLNSWKIRDICQNHNGTRWQIFSIDPHIVYDKLYPNSPTTDTVKWDEAVHQYFNSLLTTSGVILRDDENEYHPVMDKRIEDPSSVPSDRKIKVVNGETYILGTRSRQEELMKDIYILGNVKKGGKRKTYRKRIK
jgi:hypothetical protein